MHINELFSQDHQKPELDYDLKDDLMVFMNNDPMFYRKRYFPTMIKFNQYHAEGRRVHPRAFAKLVQEAYDLYKNKFQVEGLMSSLPEDMCEDICKAIHEQETQNCKDRVYGGGNKTRITEDVVSYKTAMANIEEMLDQLPQIYEERTLRVKSGNATFNFPELRHGMKTAIGAATSRPEPTDVFRRLEMTVEIPGDLTKSNRWFQKFYFNNLSSSLHYLVNFMREIKRDADVLELRYFLSKVPKNFSDLEYGVNNVLEKSRRHPADDDSGPSSTVETAPLPEILERLGQTLENPQLTAAASAWIHAREKFQKEASAIAMKTKGKTLVFPRVSKEPITGDRYKVSEMPPGAYRNAVEFGVKMLDNIIDDPEKMKIIRARLDQAEDKMAVIDALEHELRNRGVDLPIIKHPDPQKVMSSFDTITGRVTRREQERFRRMLFEPDGVTPKTNQREILLKISDMVKGFADIDEPEPTKPTRRPQPVITSEEYRQKALEIQRLISMNLTSKDTGGKPSGQFIQMLMRNATKLYGDDPHKLYLWWEKTLKTLEEKLGRKFQKLS